METFILFYVPLGLLSGFLAGLFGIGVGIIVVPALVFYFDLLGFSEPSNYHLAVGTSLCAMLGATLSAAWCQFKRGNMDWLLLRWLLPGTSIGCLVSAYVFADLPGEFLRYAFALFLLFVLIRFVRVDFYAGSLGWFKMHLTQNTRTAILFAGGLLTGPV